MYDGVGWPVRSIQRTIIVLTLQASLENQSFTQGYTVCCRKRLTLGYDRYALSGLMNVMSRFMLILLQKTVQNILSILNTLPVRGAEFNITMNYAPLTGAKLLGVGRDRGMPLSYNIRPILGQWRENHAIRKSKPIVFQNFINIIHSAFNYVKPIFTGQQYWG